MRVDPAIGLDQRWVQLYSNSPRRAECSPGGSAVPPLLFGREGATRTMETNGSKLIGDRTRSAPRRHISLGPFLRKVSRDENFSPSSVVEGA